VRASRAAPGNGDDWDTTAPPASSCTSSPDSGGGARGTEQQRLDRHRTAAAALAGQAAVAGRAARGAQAEDRQVQFVFNFVS
jgi:hypothetical protein